MCFHPVIGIVYRLCFHPVIGIVYRLCFHPVSPKTVSSIFYLEYKTFSYFSINGSEAKNGGIFTSSARRGQSLQMRAHRKGSGTGRQIPPFWLHFLDVKSWYISPDIYRAHWPRIVFPHIKAEDCELCSFMNYFRWMTCQCLLDFNTMAGADKFGNIFVVSFYTFYQVQASQ